MKKMTLILMIAGAALVSFGGAFGAAWLTRPHPADVNQAEASHQPETPGAAEMGLGPHAQQTSLKPTEQEVQRAMTEEQLRSLVNEVKEKVRQYEEKLRGLQDQEQQLKVVQQSLQEDFKKLEDLRLEVATAVANLKVQRDELEKSRLLIGQAELQGLRAVALTYDKMDAESAGRILAGMCKPVGQVNSMEDAVKILYYMSDKKKAEVLAAIMASDADLAGRLSLKLTQVTEKR